MPTRPKTHRPQQTARKPWKKQDSPKRLEGRARKDRSVRIRRRDPLCRICLEQGRVTESVEVDHITPLAHGGTEDDSNLQGLCVECHMAKSQAERAHADILPRDLERPSKPLVVVCGPPAAGKTTYVREHACPNDMVLDLDVLAMEQGKPLHEMEFEQKRMVIAHRNAMLAVFCRGDTPHERCWLIATAGSYKHRKFWADLGAEVIPINPGALVCKERIMADTLRPLWTQGSRAEAVDHWA